MVGPYVMNSELHLECNLSCLCSITFFKHIMELEAVEFAFISFYGYQIFFSFRNLSLIQF